ncbi:OsmC family protein [Flavobacterium sp.]|uniref:OsmC family protein n=1 Tax=Flavobacterium sp. TaxID=239 RepID=UPI002630BC47|nr:OsmC family protein [Flavobacterium sp.]MDG2433336.1 OsmC family protein [Flavobacterium sp.]
MSFKQVFKAKLSWLLKEESTFATAKKYTKSHSVVIEGKELLHVSAAKAFKGDPSLYNPEDLLLSSVVSCHMMSYLYVCQQNGIEILSYQDDAEATLEVLDTGGGRFIEVRLFPTVIVKEKEQIDLAIHLHVEANRLCFIANSCNFPIVHQASCEAI